MLILLLIKTLKFSKSTFTSRNFLLDFVTLNLSFSLYSVFPISICSSFFIVPCAFFCPLLFPSCFYVSTLSRMQHLFPFYIKYYRPNKILSTCRFLPHYSTRHVTSHTNNLVIVDEKLPFAHLIPLSDNIIKFCFLQLFRKKKKKKKNTQCFQLCNLYTLNILTRIRKFAVISINL